MAVIWRRIKERKLGQWAIAYLAGAWLLLQVIGLLGGFFDWSDAAGRIATVILAVGFFAALVLAWFHGERGEQRVTGTEIGMLAALLVIAGVLVFVARGTPQQKEVADVTSAEHGSLAVLPFANLSGNANEEHFSDGITEELLHALANVEGLRVPARTSSFAFKGQQTDVREVAKKLGVAHVLEGSVRRSGKRVKITAQLIAANDGYHVWSQSYDRESSDVLAVQEEIAQAIVEALQVKLLPARQGRILTGGTTNPDAHDAYLRGLAALDRRSPESLTTAIQQFERAIELDPRFARAHSAIAQAYWLAISYRGDALVDAIPRVRAAARRALELDPALGEPEAVLGMVVWDTENDHAAAARHFEAAIRKEPGSARSRHWRSILLRNIGKREEGIAEAERAAALDPLSAIRRSNMAMHYLRAGEYQRALQHARTAQALDSLMPGVHDILGEIHLHLGRYDEAVRSYERKAQLVNESAQEIRDVIRGIADVRTEPHAAARSREPALRVLRAWERQGSRTSGYTEPLLVGTFYFLLNDRDAALRVFDRALDELHPSMRELGCYSALAPLHSDARFVRLLRRMNLSPEMFRQPKS